MGILLIHGFLHEKQKATPEWGSISISETVLVEMDSPEDSLITLLSELPSGVGTITGENPKGIGFTFDISVHPDSSSFILRTAGEVVQSSEGGCFWEITLNYSNKSYAQMIGSDSGGGGNTPKTNPKQRKDQREVLSPLDKPYVWSTSSSLVQKETYKHATTKKAIRHTNGLPITQPYKYEEVHETHTFSYNVDFPAFNYTFYDGFIGMVSSGVTLGKPAGTLKLTAFSASEEYESNGEGVNKINFHYVRVNITFEYNPSGWDEDAKLVSMSTLQRAQQIVSPFAIFYDKIKISATEYAQEPWPLDANGAAILYTNNDPDDYGYVDTGYPKTANLSAITGVKGLKIP